MLLDDENHFLLQYDGFVGSRTEFLQCIIDNIDDYLAGSEIDILKVLFAKENIRITARYVEKMFMEQKDQIFSQEREAVGGKEDVEDEEDVEEEED